MGEPTTTGLLVMVAVALARALEWLAKVLLKRDNNGFHSRIAVLETLRREDAAEIERLRDRADRIEETMERRTRPR